MLPDGHSYRLTVTGVQDTGGRVIDPDPSETVFTAAAGGLMARYWNNETLSGNPVYQQVVTTVDNYWGNASPVPGTVNLENFSIRWDGYIQAPRRAPIHSGSRRTMAVVCSSRT